MSYLSFWSSIEAVDTVPARDEGSFIAVVVCAWEGFERRVLWAVVLLLRIVGRRGMLVMVLRRVFTLEKNVGALGLRISDGVCWHVLTKSGVSIGLQKLATLPGSGERGQ